MSRVRALLLCTVGLAAAGCIDAIVGSDPPNTPGALFETVWRDFDRYYGSFAVKQVDWDAVHARYAPAAAAAPTSDSLAQVIASMFRELHDPHVDLARPGAKVLASVDISRFHTYFDPGTVAHTFGATQETTTRHFRYGFVAPDVAWIWVPTFGSSGWTHELDDVLTSLASARALILDVRDDGGGSSRNAEDVAARFMDGPRSFGYVRYRNGPAHDDFGPYLEKHIAPAGVHFAKPVIVLTNRKSASATEDFVFAMRAQPGVRFVGDTTIGGLVAPLIRELPNGWTYRLPHSLQYGLAKDLHEGIGLAPDVYVRATQADSLAGRDAQLERAIALLAASASASR